MKDWKVIAGVIALIGILAGGYFFKEQIPSANVQTQQSNSTASSNTGTLNGNIREFRVIGKNYAFTPTEMRVKQGETVRIVFENTQGFHDFRIDELNVATNKMYEGKEEAVEFTASEQGTFSYYCSVISHRQYGMEGKLVVE